MRVTGTIHFLKRPSFQACAAGGSVGRWLASPGGAPRWAILVAVLVAINLQTSFLTPPFGFALFYLKGIAPKEVRIQSIYKGIIPFVLLQCLGVIAVLVFPDIALWLMHVVHG